MNRATAVRLLLTMKMKILLPSIKFELFLHIDPFKVKIEANLQGIFLSDPSPIIAMHCLPLSLTDSCLVDLIDVTLARKNRGGCC